MKGAMLLGGVIFTLSAVVAMVVKTFCTEDSVLYPVFIGSNVLLNFMLGGILLYVYIGIKQQS